MFFYLWAKLFKKIQGVAIKNSYIHYTSKIQSGSHIENTNFNKYSYCGYNCQIINCDIGSFSSIANNVVIGGSEHPTHWVSTSPIFYKGARNSLKIKFSKHKRPDPLKTFIGNDVWIGERVLVKSGVTIADGAVVGMGSVVTKDVEAYSIVAGSPAKTIKMRFDNETIKLLLELKWWEWEETKIREYAKFFNDVKEFKMRLSK